MFIYYILIGLLILIGLATLGGALFGQARRQRLLLLGLTLILWVGAGLLWLVKPSPPPAAMPPWKRTLQPSTPSPTITPTPHSRGRIAFHSERSGNLDIWVMNDDGSEPLRLTDAGERDIEPDWSPDGDFVVFASARDDVYDMELYVMRNDGSDQHLLMYSQPGDDWGARWSPDGSRILYQSNRDENFELYTVNHDGEEMTNISQHSANESRPDWSPDGQHIVFVSDRDGNNEIYIMDQDGANVVRLTDHPADDTNPHWSPVGEHILFESTREHESNIYLMATDGTGLLRLTKLGHDDTSPCWAMEGEKIVFSSKRNDDDWELYVMNPDGSDVVRLTESDGFDRFPAWTRYGATGTE